MSSWRSRPQRPRSFWSAPGIAGADQKDRSLWDENGALERCAMRSRTGSSALHCSKVQNMAASEIRWLVEKVIATQKQ